MFKALSLVLSPFISIHEFTIYRGVIALRACLHALISIRTYIRSYTRMHICFHVYLYISMAGFLCSRLILSRLCQFMFTTCSNYTVEPVSGIR